MNWTEQWLVPIERTLKALKSPGSPDSPEEENLILLIIRMVSSLLMNYFPEEYGWKWDTVAVEERKDESVYLVECHDGKDPTEHLLVLVLPDGPHGSHLIHSIQRFQKICQSRFGITPQDEEWPGLVWGAIFQGARSLFYQYEKGGEIRPLVDPRGENGPYSIRNDCGVIHFLLESMSHERSNRNRVSWKGLARSRDSNRPHSRLSSRP